MNLIKQVGCVEMVDRLNRVIQKIEDLKQQLNDLWETRQKTDEDVLALSSRIDRLLNEHDRLLRNLAD